MFKVISNAAPLRACCVLATLAACAPPPPAPDPPIAERRQGRAAPTSADRIQVMAETALYLDAVANGRAGAALALHSEELRVTWPEADWRAEMSAGLARDLDGAVPVSILWRQGLHRFEGPELYAIVRLSGTARGARNHLIWRRDPGGFVLENFIRR